MKSVTMYTRPGCGYCVRAKRLLLEKGVEVQDIPAGSDPDKKAEMIERSGGGRTFPQIFIGDAHVGGCDELLKLEREGRLDQMLAA